MRRPRRLSPLLPAAALAAAACTAPRATMTFEEAGIEEAVEPDGPPAPPSSPSPRVSPEEARPGPPIDAALLRFAAEARGRRSRLPQGEGFPAEAAAAWRELAAVLDGYLARPLLATPLAELVRARVTVEAEMEWDRRRYGPPPDEVRDLVAARLARLAARVAACRALGRPLLAARPPAALRWPVEHAGLSSPFGMRLHPLDGRPRMHYGIDLAADPGRVVDAAARGFVTHAGWSPGYGLMVEVRHPGDLVTRYSHLSRLLCAPGDAVEPGQPLGLVGATGRTTGPHLHFEVWSGGHARDPLAMLSN